MTNAVPCLRATLPGLDAVIPLWPASVRRQRRRCRRLRSGTATAALDDGDVRCRQPSAKLPLFDPVVPLFEHDRPDHDLTARTADRAVLVRLRRFLAAIHVPSEGLVRQALSTN